MASNIDIWENWPDPNKHVLKETEFVIRHTRKHWIVSNCIRGQRLIGVRN